MVNGNGGAVAVVGATGFIGSHLVAALRAAGREVSSFTRSHPFLVAGRLDPDVVSAKTIFWLASSINPLIAAEHPERVAADKRSFEDLLGGLSASGATSTVVILSSGGTVYDPQSAPPYREQSPLRPSSDYGAAKVELERVLARSAPAAHVTVRVSNAYGPGQLAKSGQGVIAYWMAAARNGEPIRIIGDPDSARDYIYVTDIAAALVAIDRTDPTALPSALNIGSGTATSLGQLATLLEEVIEPTPLRVERQPPRPFDVDRTWLAIDLAEAAIGWRPVTSLRDGLTETWAHVSLDRSS